MKWSVAERLQVLSAGKSALLFPCVGTGKSNELLSMAKLFGPKCFEWRKGQIFPDFLGFFKFCFEQWYRHAMSEKKGRRQKKREETMKYNTLSIFYVIPPPPPPLFYIFFLHHYCQRMFSWLPIPVLCWGIFNFRGWWKGGWSFFVFVCFLLCIFFPRLIFSSSFFLLFLTRVTKYEDCNGSVLSSLVSYQLAERWACQKISTFNFFPTPPHKHDVCQTLLYGAADWAFTCLCGMLHSCS